MGATGIEWTIGPNGEPGFTFNPWIGCTRVSPACKHCYAADLAKARYGIEWDAPPVPVTETTFVAPRAWNRRALREDRRFRVFTASMADFLDNRAPRPLRARAVDQMEQCEALDWLILTKRPQMALKLLPKHWFAGDWPPNVWFGFTGENQEEFDRRAPHVRDIPAPVRFVSVEPMLGPIVLPIDAWEWLDWVICGGESGKLAEIRDTPIGDMISLAAQCAVMNIPFFAKQLAQLSARKDYKDFASFPEPMRRREQPRIRLAA